MHDDHLGSVAALTAADGTVIARFGYDPWGLRRNADGSEAVITTAATDRGYTGHEMLDGLRLVHMNARVYNPQLGRFLSADSIVPDPNSALGFNRYAYVYNNPLTLLDPSGMKPFWRKESFRKYGLPVIAIAASWAVVYFMPALIAEMAALAGVATEGASFVLASKAITGAAGGFTGGVISNSGDLKAGAIGALTGGAFAYVGTLGPTANLVGHSVVEYGSVQSDEVRLSIPLRFVEDESPLLSLLSFLPVSRRRRGLSKIHLNSALRWADTRQPSTSITALVNVAKTLLGKMPLIQ